MNARIMKFIIVVVITFLIIMPAPGANAETKTSASLTITGNNSYVYIASGGVVVIGIFYVFSGGRYSKKKSSSDTMYASLFNFDMKRDSYELAIPELRLDDENVFMPLFTLKF